MENVNFINYEVEKHFITTPYNKASYYIPGKVITVDANGNIGFYPLDDINDFVYGQDIEAEFVYDNYQLTVDEKELIGQLENINIGLNKKGLQAVYLRKDKDDLYIFLTSEENPEVFYKVMADAVDKLELEMLEPTPINNLETAILIKI